MDAFAHKIVDHNERDMNQSYGYHGNTNMKNYNIKTESVLANNFLYHKKL